MADPIARGINTFAALKGMEYQGQQARRLERLDEEAREDRAQQRQRLQLQDSERAEDRALMKSQLAEQTDWSRLERGRKLEEWSEADIAKAREEADNILLSAVKQAEVNKAELDVPGLLAQLEPVKQGLKRKLAALYDPQAVEDRTQATLGLLKQLRTGSFDHEALVENANLAFADELDARGEKYGAKQVRFTRLVPSPQGDGFMAEAEITKADGSTYRAPLTENGGTADQGDNTVKVFRMEQVAPYLVGKLQTLQGAKTYLESRGKIAAPKQEWVFGADGELRMDKFSGTTESTGYVKPGKDGVGAGGSGRGGKGKSGSLTGEDYKQFNTLYDRQFLVEYQKTLPAGQDNTDAFMVTDPYSGEKRVDMDRVVMQMPEALRNQYLVGKTHGETFMADGYQPMAAANQAVKVALSRGQSGAPGAPQGEAAPKGATQEAIEQVPVEQLNLLRQGLKNAEAAGKEEAIGYLEELRQKQPVAFAALTRTLQKSGAPLQARGMAGPAAEPVRDQIYTNLNRSMQQGGWNPDYPVELVGKGLSALWQIAPARLAASGLADALKGFQQWAQSRYQSPDAAKSSQALAEYAKENPQAAEQIAKAALQAAQ